MTDEERIPRILEKLERLWMAKTPNQRLGQLLTNLRGTSSHDLFYYPDEELEKELDRRLDRIDRLDRLAEGMKDEARRTTTETTADQTQSA